MQDLDKLLKEVFQDKKSILAHLKITIGSVLMTYLVPQSETDALIENAQPKHSFMPQVGVCGLRIGLTPVIINKTENELEATHFSFEYSLISAVKNDDINVVTFLLDINTNPDSTDDEGQTALMVGSASGRDEAVRLLLNAKADPNFWRRDGITPLYKAAQNGHFNVVNILLRGEANPNFPADDGTTPLDIARQNGNSDIVSTLQKFCVSEGATAKPLPRVVALSEANFLQISRELTKSQSVSIIFLGKRGCGKTSLSSAIAGMHMDTSKRWEFSSRTTRLRIQVGQSIVNVFDTHEMMGSTDTAHDDMIFDLAGRNDLKLVNIICIEMYEQLDEVTLETLAQKLTSQDVWARFLFC